MSRPNSTDSSKRDQVVGLPYDWASKPPTKDTAAATEQVLRDKSGPRR